MIAAGDFDAEENAAPADASTNDKSDQPTEEAVVKEEEKVSEVLQEPSEEKSKEVSDEEKKEEQEASASAGNELGSGEDDKYTKEDTPRRIFVKHIDRKKNPDDIEDYFFDTYKDTGLEDVYTCTVYNARSQRRMFFGNVILTFDTEDNAKKFLEMKLKNEERMTWKRKLVRHTLAEVQKRGSCCLCCIQLWRWCEHRKGCKGCESRHSSEARKARSGGAEAIQDSGLLQLPNSVQLQPRGGTLPA